MSPLLEFIGVKHNKYKPWKHTSFYQKRAVHPARSDGFHHDPGIPGMAGGIVPILRELIER